MKKQLKLFVLVIGTAVILGACGASSADTANTATETANYRAADNAAEYDTGEAFADTDEVAEEETEKRVSAGENMSADQKITYTCNLEIETEEYDETISAIRDKISNYECVVSYESESDSDIYWYYSDRQDSASMHMYLSVMVPAESYDLFVNDICDTGKVLSKNMSAENITKNYSETKAYVDSLSTELEKLQNMMEQAEDIEDMLAIEDRITEVETQLNRYKSDLANLETQIQYSTVNINVSEVKEYTPTTMATENFGERIVKTFREAWDNFGTFLQGLLLVVILLLPFIALIAVILAVVLIVIKKRKAAKKKNKEP